MNMRFRSSLLIAAMALFACSSAVASDIPWMSDIDAAIRVAQQSNRMVLVHFYTDSCPPCKRLESVVYSQPGVGPRIAANYVPVKINAEHNRKLARQLGVDRWPTDVILDASGKKLTKQPCPINQAAYLGQLAQAARYLGTASRVQMASRPGAPTAGPLTPPPTATPRNGSMGPATPENYFTRPPATNPGVASVPPRPGASAKQYQIPPRNGAVAQPRVATAPPAYQPAQPPIRNGVQQMEEQRRQQGLAYAPPAYSPAPKQPAPQPRVTTRPPVNPPAPQPGVAAQPPAYQPPMYNPAPQQPAPQPRVTTRPPMTPPAPQPRVATQPPAHQPPPYSLATRQPAPRPQLNPPAQVRTQQAPPQPSPFALDGMCPVALAETETWAQGDKRYGAVHRGKTYLFAGQEQQRKFLANPDYFAPAISGLDPVLAFDHGQRVSGHRNHGLTLGSGANRRVYLFASEQTLAQFCNDKVRYESAVRTAEAGQQPLRR